MYLVELLNVLIINILMGLGGISGIYFNFIGMLGMYGSFEVNKVMVNVDVILVLGVWFDDWVMNNVKKFCLNVIIVYVDVDLILIFKIIKVYILVVGCLKIVFE